MESSSVPSYYFCNLIDVGLLQGKPMLFFVCLCLLIQFCEILAHVCAHWIPRHRSSFRFPRVSFCFSVARMCAAIKLIRLLLAPLFFSFVSDQLSDVSYGEMIHFGTRIFHFGIGRQVVPYVSFPLAYKHR